MRTGDAPPEAFLELGDLLREDGDPERALALHRGVLARPALGADLRRLAEMAVAQDLMELGRIEEAADRLAALDERLVDGELLALRARALHRLGRWDDAAAVLRRRVKLVTGGATDLARYLAETGREALVAGQTDTARRRARDARRLDAGLAVAYVVEGDARSAEGKVVEALQLWRDGLVHARDKRGPLLARVVEFAFQSGRMESVVEDLEELRETRPDDPELWGAVADLRLRRGDRETFLGLIEDPPSGHVPSLERCVSWLRHLVVQDDEDAVRRLLRVLPESFGARLWRCPACGAEEGEPRECCMHCGRLVANHAAPQRLRRQTLLLEGEIS